MTSPINSSSIISSLGAGSGINTSQLTEQLVDIERSAPQARIDSKREKAETQISDYGLLSSALATLQDAADVLAKPEGLFSKTASFTESKALVPVELDTDVQAGTYTFTVEAVAASQSLTSTSFTALTDEVGEGTLTFRFGQATVDGAGAMLNLNGFTQDTNTTDVDITIDSTNNTLEGLRDAINDANFGVQATIINDGLNGYLLQITAESGANNELEISVVEAGGAPSNNDNTGLSRFTFNETASQLTQKQSGADAELTINGLTVYRESNIIDDIVQGLELNVLQSDPGVPVTITVTDDKNFAEENIRAFVESYNVFLDAIKPAVGTYEKENAEGKKETLKGSLANDPLSKSILSKIRSVIASAIPGLTGANFTSLGAIGIRTELDGTMSIDEESFKKAFDSNFADVQKLFAPNLATSDDSIYINSYNSKTKAGSYDVVITTPPTQGVYQGGALAAFTALPNFSTVGKTYEFTVEINGQLSNSLVIPEATYADQAALAEVIESLINNDQLIADNGGKVSVEYNAVDNRFDLTSSKYGSGSNVSILIASAEIETDLGFAVATGTAGTTVAGTVNGTAGFGSSNVLLPKLGEEGEGLAMVVGENATAATVSFSRGFAGELSALLDEYLASNGLIKDRESNLDSSLKKLDTEEEKLDRRMTAYQERLMNQFIAMERIINSLNSSGSFLDNLINTLPFTAKND